MSRRKNITKGTEDWRRKRRQRTTEKVGWRMEAKKIEPFRKAKGARRGIIGNCSVKGKDEPLASEVDGAIDALQWAIGTRPHLKEVKEKVGCYKEQAKAKLPMAEQIKQQATAFTLVRAWQVGIAICVTTKFGTRYSSGHAERV